MTSTEQATPPRGAVLRFAGVRRTVSDLDRAIDFHVGALGFTADRSGHGLDPELQAHSGADPARCARLTLGDETLELYSPVGFERHPGPDAVDDGVSNAAFQHLAIVTNDMAAAVHRLMRYSPSLISSDGAVRLPSAAGGVSAFKFRDPDGHPLELIQFPAGVGDPKWQRAGSPGPNLGIDHTAIAVGDVERSLVFYVQGLGLSLSSRQVNRGPEQTRLDGAAASEVEVVGLAPAGQATPHLELLGYHTPLSQAHRADEGLAEDHTDRTSFTVDDLPGIIARLEALRPDSAHQHLRYGDHALRVRDDDGHVLLLLQATRD